MLVAGLRSRRGASYRILERIDAGHVVPILSVPLVLEYEEVLKRQHRVLRLKLDEIDRLLDDLCRLGEWHLVYFLWRPTLRDPRDELVLEVAVAARCTEIVTHNVRDFAGSEAFGVAAIRPKEWLTKLGGSP